MKNNITTIDGERYYTVLFDNNRDGAKDEVYFINGGEAALFDDCFVNGESTRRCQDWLLQQASSTYLEDGIAGIQYKTADGRNSKFCEDSGWIWGLDNLKGILGSFRERMSDLSPTTLVDMGRSLFQFSTGRLSDAEAKSRLGKYLLMLNEASGKNIGKGDLEFIKDLAWSHRRQMMKGLDLFFEPEGGDASFEEMISNIDGQCFSSDKEYCIAEDDKTLTDRELVEVHRRFGRFENCMPEAKEYSNGRSAYGVLNRDTKIADVVYAKDSYIEYNEDGSVSEGVLSKRQDVDGIMVPAGTKVVYDGYQRISSLAIPKGKTVEAEGVEYAENVEFSGWSVSGGTLAVDQDIGGVRYAGGKFISFFNDGRVKHGTLKDDQTVGGVLLNDGDRVLFYEKGGGLKQVHLAHNSTVNGIYCASRRICEAPEPCFSVRTEDVAFDQDGSLAYAELASTQNIDGVMLPAGTKIKMSEGKLVSAVLGGEATVNGVKWPANSELTFYRGTGNVAMVSPRQDVTVQGVKCESQARDYYDFIYVPVDSPETGIIGNGHPYTLSFHRDGQLYSAYLDGDQTIQGIRIPDYSRVEFDKNGRLRKIDLSRDAVVKGSAFNADDTLLIGADGNIKKATSRYE